MKRLNPEHVRIYLEKFNSAPVFQALSMQIREAEPGHSKVEIALEQKHLHPFGFVHGGIVATIVDTAALWAVFYSLEDEDAGMISVDLSLNFLAKVSTGLLTAVGTQIKLGKRLGYSSVEVTDDSGELIAHGTSTLLVQEGNVWPFETKLPPKFLD